MRLTPDTCRTIKESVLDMFGPNATVRVFGSRTNDEARGGDIDLLVECAEPVKDRLKKSLALTARLQIRLGDQRIDVIVTDPETKPQSVHEIARRTGVPL
jgi:predicted nucleotidyltransferase